MLGESAHAVMVVEETHHVPPASPGKSVECHPMGAEVQGQEKMEAPVWKDSSSPFLCLCSGL